MLILWKARQKDPGLGYATTFLRQMEEVLGTCLERGVKVVANAGGLNPAGLAAKLTELSGRLGLNTQVAYLTGDDLIPVLGDLQAAGHDLVNLDTGVAAGQGGPAGGHRQRLPRRLGHHRGAAGRRGRGGLPPGHRREPGHRARRLVARLAPGRLGRPGRRGRRRARHRVRPAGDRRQLQLPGRDHQPPLPRVPDRRGRRGRQQRHHQARRHRRRRLDGHRHRPAALRDRRPRLPQPRRRRAFRHHPADAARARTGSR